MTFDPSVGPPEPEPLETPTRPFVAEPPRVKKGWGCGTWALILIAAFFLATTVLLLLVFVGFASAKGDIAGAMYEPSYRRLIEYTVQGDGANKILLLPVNGVIGEAQDDGFLSAGAGVEQSIREALLKAREDGDISGIILSINSPGGGITASDIIRQEIFSFKEETGIPVVALFGDLAASGGYYVATSADYIVAHPTTITGSIGVIMPLVGAQDLLQKIGVEIRPVKSGEMKDMGAFYRDLTPEGLGQLQDIVDQLHQRFVSLVVQGMQIRKVNRTPEEILPYCDGRILTSAQAKDAGFVDEIGYARDAFKAVCERANISPDESRLVTFQHKPGLLDLLLAKGFTPSPKAVTIDLNTLKGTQSPRFMYLWTVGE